MYRSLKTLSALALLASASAAVHASDTADKLVTVLTVSEPQSQLMGMVLTFQAAQQGADTHVLLCGPAADIALKEAPASATAPQEPKGMSPQGLMQMMMDKAGTTVEVCAIYLPNAGLEASALLDGIEPADPVEMTARLIAEDTQVLGL